MSTLATLNLDYVALFAQPSCHLRITLRRRNDYAYRVRSRLFEDCGIMVVARQAMQTAMWVRVRLVVVPLHVPPAAENDGNYRFPMCAQRLMYSWILTMIVVAGENTAVVDTGTEIAAVEVQADTRDSLTPNMHRPTTLGYARVSTSNRDLPDCGCGPASRVPSVDSLTGMCTVRQSSLLSDPTSYPSNLFRLHVCIHHPHIPNALDHRD